MKNSALLITILFISWAGFSQDWIEVSSGLPAGKGIGQISVGMNNPDALWALAINDDGTIYDAFSRSTDGGQTWTAGTFNAGTGLSQLFAIDANICWAVFNTGANQGLYKTEDGGTTWTKKDDAYGSGSFANVIHFFNDNDGFAQGDAVGGYYELYTTTDGGESWTRVPENDIPAPTSGEYGITGNYSAVGNSIWWGTNQGRVFYSSDKGYTWDATLTPFGATQVVQPLFKDENVGIAYRSYLDLSLEPQLNITSNGGATWTTLNVIGDMYARWFEFIPGTTGTWLGSSSEPGEEGISYSLDDCISWDDLTVGFPVQAPVFLDNETGWAGTWSNGSSSGILIYNGDPIGGAGGAEIVEDFENYNAGEKVVEQALAQGLEYWTCWSGDGGAGGAEDGTISTEQAFAGSNSVMCDGTNDFVMLFGDKTAGKYSVDFYMYIPSGFVGYYNILQAWGPSGTGATWGLEVYFNPGGIAELTAENTSPLETFSYPYDTWFHMENIINLNQDEATLLINGTEVATWEWSVGASGVGINQLAAMDIYAAATNGTPKFFIDDIQLLELEPPVGPPTVAVDPVSFDVSIDAGTTMEETLTISNDGIAELVWSAYPQYSTDKSYRGIDYDNSMDYKSVEIPEVSVSKGLGYPAPENGDADITLNYDGENVSAVGLTNGGTFEFGAKFTTDIVNPYITMDIHEVQVFVNDIVTNSVIRVYGHGFEGSPGAVLLEQEFSSIIGWNNISLDIPVTISGGDTWVTCEVTHDAGLFPAGNDSGPHTTNGDWFRSGAAWVPMHVANPALDANWNIRAVATGDPMDGWIMLDPGLGEISGGNSQEINITLDATGLTVGTYNSNIVINSNDPVNPVVTVPVTLNVTVVEPIHFNPIWSSPYNPMTFYVLQANLDDLPMQPGDEIGLFDIDPNSGTEICVGAGKLIEELNGTIFLEVIASMDDGSNPDEANGFTPGNQIIYKLWNEASGEITNVNSAYPYPGYDEVYTSQGSAFVELNGFTTINQCIGLTTGWNIISSRAMPENSDMLNVVQPLIDQEILVKVLDESGGSIFHLPFPPPNGQWSNTIGNIELTEGYYMKVLGAGTLCIEGYPAETPLEIPLTTGWNIISYPCEYSRNALDAVQALINEGVLYKVIDEAGGSIFHLPFPPPNGQWSNTIGNFEAGEGYYVKVNENTSLTISCPADGAESTGVMPKKTPTSYFQPVFENNPYMPMHVVLQTTELLEPGDEIAVFDGVICVGATVYQGEENDYSIVSCAMDDPSSGYIDGFTAGNNLYIRIWKRANNEVVIPVINIMEGSNSFEALGTLVAGIDMLTSNHETVPVPGISIHVGPNPFKESTKISYAIPCPGELTVRVLDVHGNVVFENPTFHAEQSQGEVLLDFTNYEPGVYLMWISFRNTDTNRVITKRIIHF